jgi:hypothetical protein
VDLWWGGAAIDQVDGGFGDGRAARIVGTGGDWTDRPGWCGGEELSDDASLTAPR